MSPVLEIFSEHGLAEHDRGPQDYIRHSNGGRWTRNTMRSALKRGFRVGVIASSDDHAGYPGAYGEGMVGIYAKELTIVGSYVNPHTFTRASALLNAGVIRAADLEIKHFPLDGVHEAFAALREGRTLKSIIHPGSH